MASTDLKTILRSNCDLVIIVNFFVNRAQEAADLANQLVTV